MRLNVQYIPISKIKPDSSVKMTDHIRRLKSIMWDCMHLLVVKKNKNGQYTLLTGKDRLEYLQKHTKNKRVPCLVDEKTMKSEQRYWIANLFNKENISPNCVSIIRKFVKQEPRFQTLSGSEKLKVLLLAIRYRRTVILSMKKKVDEFK